MVAGGAVAAYLLQQNQIQPITPGDGALVGLFAGLIGAGVFFVISIPISILLEPMQRAMIQRTLEMSGSMPPAVREMLENYGEPRTAVGFMGRVFLRLIGFVFMLCVGAVFSTLGGLLGAAIFKKTPPPAAQM